MGVPVRGSYKKEDFSVFGLISGFPFIWGNYPLSLGPVTPQL